ncbi:MAG: roadblock/LC7 domain-containing protein, partial [Promethearchaeota archaeon]
MVDRSKLHALLEWMFQSVGNDLLSLVVVDREGLVLDSLMVKGIDEELIGGIAALVEPVLKRIAKEFDSGNFGTGSFDTEKFRLIFCEAGPEAVLVMIADLLASLDAIFPYA